MMNAVNSIAQIPTSAFAEALALFSFGTEFVVAHDIPWVAAFPQGIALLGTGLVPQVPCVSAALWPLRSLSKWTFTEAKDWFLTERTPDVPGTRVRL
jgi:hypothetical protein